MATTSAHAVHVTARGRDIYAITAPLVCAAAEQILGRPPAGGTYSPGELFEADAFLTAVDQLPIDRTTTPAPQLRGTKWRPRPARAHGTIGDPAVRSRSQPRAW